MKVLLGHRKRACRLTHPKLKTDKRRKYCTNSDERSAMSPSTARAIEPIVGKLSGSKTLGFGDELSRLRGFVGQGNEKKRVSDSDQRDGPAGVMLPDSGDEENGDGGVGGGAYEDIGERRADEEQDSGDEQKQAGDGANGAHDERLGFAIEDAAVDEFLHASCGFKRPEDDCEK